MKQIKQLIRFLRINFIIAKYGLNTVALFLKLSSSGRFTSYLNPRNWFRKQPASLNKMSAVSLKNFKPLSSKPGQTQTHPNKISPDAIEQKSNKLKDKVSHYIQPPDPIETTSFNTSELGKKLIKIWDDLNLTQISGEEVAHHIGSLVNKGNELKKQFSQSVQQNMTEYLQKELPSRTELNDFFNNIDELSLRIERLQAQVNKLMSPHEIT